MVHHLYVGHFENDGDVGRTKRDGHGIPRLIRTRPLDPILVEEALRTVGGEAVHLGSIPAHWDLWPEDGYLVCDHYTRSRRAIEFVIRVVRATGCEMFDSNLFPRVTVESLERRLALPVRWLD